MDPLILNIILYLSVVYAYWHKYHKFTATFAIILMYAIFAVNAYLLWNYGVYKWGPYQKQPLSFIPYVYTFVGFLIFLSPIFKRNLQQKLIIVPISSKKANVLYWFFFIELLLGALLNFSHATSVTDFTDVYHSETAVSTGLAGQLRIVSTAVYLPALALIGYYSSDMMLNMKRAFFLLLAYFFNNIIEAMTCGSRGVLFFAVLNVLILLFIFRDSINAKIKMILLVSTVGTTLFVFSIALAISVDRFGDEAWNWIYSYFGEPFLNISLYYWNAPFTTGGAITFAPFVKINYYDHNYIMILFKLFSGQAMLDFGVIGGLVFLIIISFILYLMMPRGKYLTFSKAMVLIYAYYHCMFGVFGIRVYGWSAYALLIILYYYTKQRRIKNN